MPVVSPSDLKEAGFTAQAVIHVDPAHFTDIGLIFARSRDDRGEYDIVDIAGSRTLPSFALRHHARDHHRVTLLFSAADRRALPFEPMMQAMALALGVPCVRFRPCVHLTPEEQDTYRCRYSSYLDMH